MVKPKFKPTFTPLDKEKEEKRRRRRCEAPLISD